MNEFSTELLREFYYKMNKIRFFEEKIERYFLDGEIPGFVHLYIGEEAIATGVCSQLTADDYIVSTHRGHGHTLAKGADVNRMMSEIFGKANGFCKGKGGSMHIAHFSVGMLGANGIVGGGINLAVGAGMSIKYKNQENVSVVFFGDGASNRGTVHEGMNLASVWKLPVIFVCENNEWASTTPYLTTTSVADISKRAIGYDMESEIVDGNDIFAVYKGFEKALNYVNSGKGPYFLECKTYRIKGHYVGDVEKYRTREEVEKVYSENNPITRFEKRVLDEGFLKQNELDLLKEKAMNEIEEAVKFAMNSPLPNCDELYEDVYAELEVRA